MIDFAARFPRTTAWGEYERGKDVDPWVFHETICSSVTMVYGRSNVGKSYLVSSMLLALLTDNHEFLGMTPVDPAKLWKPAVLWTDPDSGREYGTRLHKEGGLPPEAEVSMFHLGRTARTVEWDSLTDGLLAEGFNFVVLDNLMGATGDTNDAAALTTVFDGLTKLTNRGIPVVVLHHESEHGYSVAGAKPMGLSISTQKARAWIQVRKTNRKGLRGGNTACIIDGNGMTQPQQLVAVPQAGPFYRLVQRGPWGDSDDKPKQQRSKDRLDDGADLLAWLNTNCKGATVRDAAAKVAAHLGITESSAKQKINRAGIRKGETDKQTWVHRVPSK
ncbi:helicase RepA family protein [Mycobacterium sp. 21AC1]|uniref:AAA family ATPase n=1 Tax=[Mycobacterium] appelbergii TaxID=2939269 RepID=UPI0029392D4E|nr:AAA family ATPase [Mycobacterium sp. 21AC1]MDV3127593.1 helicase RepA family protein [Mycobacterium sp. 21AC1]